VPGVQQALRSPAPDVWLPEPLLQRVYRSSGLAAGASVVAAVEPPGQHQGLHGLPGDLRRDVGVEDVAWWSLAAEPHGEHLLPGANLRPDGGEVDGGPGADGLHHLDQPGLAGVGDRDSDRAEQPPPADEWAAFTKGYRDFGGREEWLPRFIHIIGTCEGARWAGYYGAAATGGHYSRAQFSPDTWAKVRAALVVAGLRGDPDDPYEVGAGVAWWSNRTDPGTQWPVCWYRYPG